MGVVLEKRTCFPTDSSRSHDTKSVNPPKRHRHRKHLRGARTGQEEAVVPMENGTGTAVCVSFERASDLPQRRDQWVSLFQAFQLLTHADLRRADSHTE